MSRLRRRQEQGNIRTQGWVVVCMPTSAAFRRWESQYHEGYVTCTILGRLYAQAGVGTQDRPTMGPLFSSQQIPNSAGSPPLTWKAPLIASVLTDWTHSTPRRPQLPFHPSRALIPRQRTATGRLRLTMPAMLSLRPDQVCRWQPPWMFLHPMPVLKQPGEPYWGAIAAPWGQNRGQWSRMWQGTVRKSQLYSLFKFLGSKDNLSPNDTFLNIESCSPNTYHVIPGLPMKAHKSYRLIPLRGMIFKCILQVSFYGVWSNFLRITPLAYKAAFFKVTRIKVCRRPWHLRFTNAPRVMGIPTEGQWLLRRCST